MSRAKGCNAATGAKREAQELQEWNATFALDELAVTRLRIEQALRREPSLADLLLPGRDEIDRVTRWLREMAVGGAVK